MILGFFFINGSLFKDDVIFICANVHRVNITLYVCQLKHWKLGGSCVILTGATLISVLEHSH